MKRNVLVTIVAVCALTAGAMGAIEVNMYGGNAGNAYSSGSSYDTWWSNAQYAVLNALSSYGTGNGAFVQLSGTNGESDDRPGYEAVATGFDSWQGVAGGTGEYGHRVHFVYHIKSTAGESLSLSKIKDIEVYEDGWGDTDYAIYENFYGSAVSFDNTTEFDSKKRVGYAADGTPVTSGTAEAWDQSNDDNKIVHIVGNFGMAYAAYDNDSYYGGGTHQETLDIAIADMEANLDNWRAILTYDDTVVTTQVNFVPEPATMGLLALAGVGVLLKRKRK